ncbi:MAG: energy transducer TonB [Calditrichaeota bacterium]|nr:MAG: energy transducer TonB [Calditrichota bacterium]
MKRRKNPEADLKLNYRKTLELALIVSLLLHFGLFHAFPAINVTPKQVKPGIIQFNVEDIPMTQQFKRPPPPPRPAVPIPTESEEVPEDVTIESTELNLDLRRLPPPPPPGEGQDIEAGYVFVPYDEAPYPIGGYEAIKKRLRYPEIARKAGIEGRVVVGVLIDEHGNPRKTQILKDSGSRVGFEEAAEAAVMSVKWKPAKQRDRPVKVWVSIPINFKLGDNEPRIPS